MSQSDSRRYCANSWPRVANQRMVSHAVFIDLRLGVSADGNLVRWPLNGSAHARCDDPPRGPPRTLARAPAPPQRSKY